MLLVALRDPCLGSADYLCSSSSSSTPHARKSSVSNNASGPWPFASVCSAVREHDVGGALLQRRAYIFMEGADVFARTSVKERNKQLHTYSAVPVPVPSMFRVGVVENGWWYEISSFGMMHHRACGTALLQVPLVFLEYRSCRGSAFARWFHLSLYIHIPGK